LRVVEPELSLLLKAANERPAGLSLPDATCLYLAKDHDWTCVSNDGRLRKACGELKVDVLWGLELIALVVEAGGLPKEAAASVARAIHESNPRFITKAILERFMRRIAKVR
jgi:hypothetical protein